MRILDTSKFVIFFIITKDKILFWIPPTSSLMQNPRICFPSFPSEVIPPSLLTTINSEILLLTFLLDDSLFYEDLLWWMRCSEFSPPIFFPFIVVIFLPFYFIHNLDGLLGGFFFSARKPIFPWWFVSSYSLFVPLSYFWLFSKVYQVSITFLINYLIVFFKFTH